MAYIEATKNVDPVMIDVPFSADKVVMARDAR